MEAQFISKNPYSGEIYQHFDFDQSGELQSAVEKGYRAFLFWKKQSFEIRSLRFRILAELIRKGAYNFATIITEETGKPIQQSFAEVNKSAMVCDFYAEHAERLLSAEPVFDEGILKGKIFFEPLGVILEIMPWNFPFWQVFRCTVPTLMAGNAAILKHAPNVPRSAKAIEQLFIDAGFPKALFQVVFAKTEDITYLMESTLIKGVALTGSLRAGAAVGALAGKNIKPAILELGGSDPFIVLEDADLETAAKIGVASRFNNNGQTCIAAKRFIIHKNIAEQFLHLLKIETAALVQGDPKKENVQLSVMARADLADELQLQVDRTIQAGAIVALDGGQLEKGSTVFRPMILTNIPKGSAAYEEELFGPVLSFYSVESMEAAVELANDSAFGLGSSIWTKDVNKAMSIAEQLEVGAVAVNQLMRSVPFMPFGGIKKSGIGRELGREGIRAFVNTKGILF
jgi:succinate-semialdehyde dehydrogenase/glutarate-semialdehyde dehydrogenase